MRHARLQKLQRLRRERPFYVFLFYAAGVNESSSKKSRSKEATYPLKVNSLESFARVIRDG